MLRISSLDDEAIIIVTLNEKRTIVSNCYYLFVFTHQTTKEEVKFIVSSSDDLSGYPNRYNTFQIDATQVFEDATLGSYLYDIYEQESSSNTNIDNTTNLVENGKMYLYGVDTVPYSTYNPPTTYTQYNG